MDAEALSVTTQPAQELTAGSRLRVGAVVGCVGAGSTGYVYRVLDDLGGSMAVREYFPAALAMRSDGVVRPPPPREAGFEAGRKRFEEDGEELAALDHPGLLKVQQVWAEHGTSYHAMPWYEGRTLAEVLRTAATPPSQAQLSDWLRAMADALGPVHRRLGWHGHLSPSQVMRLDSGRLMVMEISRARRFLARDSRSIERDPFAALECGGDARHGPMGPWTDVYALAAIAHYAVRGRPPQAPVRRAAYDAQEPLLQDMAGGIDGHCDDHCDSRYDALFLHGIDCGLAVRPRARPRDVPAFMARAGLQERRSRLRSSGESLLINLHLTDPAAWPSMPHSPIETVDVEMPGIDPQARAESAAEPTLATAEGPGAAPLADEAPRLAVAMPDGHARGSGTSTLMPTPVASPAHARPVRQRVHRARGHALPKAVPRRTEAPSPSLRALAWLAGLGVVAGAVTLGILWFDESDHFVLSVKPPAPVEAAAGTPMPTLAATGASSPIPDPLEPTAAGPAQPDRAEESLPRGREATTDPDEPSVAPDAVAEPQIQERGADVAMPKGAAAKPSKRAAAPHLPPIPSIAPRVSEPVAPAPTLAPAPAAAEPRSSEATGDASPSASPCPGLLARQYVGRPLDAAERQQLNALCR